MRNTFLIIVREYRERTRKKSFLLMTLLIPALMAGAMYIPIALASRRTTERRHVAVVTEASALGSAIRDQLTKKPADSNKSDQGTSTPNPSKTERSTYLVDLDTNLTEQNREALTDQVNRGKLDGYLWIPAASLAKRKISYYSKNSTNFSELDVLETAVQRALTQQQLSGRGFSPEEISSLVKSVSLEPVQIKEGKETKTSARALFFVCITMVTLLYVTVLIYGIQVMRSVIEEKSSRIMEVMLSSVTAKELMAGKIIGVGAVGLTQIAIWIMVSSILSSPGYFAAKEVVQFHLPPMTVIYFGIFFLFGYLLYSALYAAIGAMVNTEQEGQQTQLIVVLPLVFAMIIASVVIEHPNSALSFWTSMIPFCAPMLMFVRIVIETPPFWQIALCLALMLGTIWGLLLLCARIYRIGILMYGKRPTLPELLKWLRYAG